MLVCSIVSCQPICEQLTSIWNGLHQRGWMQNEATHQLESLLNSGGASWFVTNIVKVSSCFQFETNYFSLIIF